jgi:hypothetical protein
MYTLGCFDSEHVLIYVDARPYLELKTGQKFSPFSQGAQKLTGENLKLVWAKFSTIS